MQFKEVVAKIKVPFCVALHFCVYLSLGMRSVALYVHIQVIIL